MEDGVRGEESRFRVVSCTGVGITTINVAEMGANCFYVIYLLASRNLGRCSSISLAEADEACDLDT